MGRRLAYTVHVPREGKDTEVFVAGTVPPPWAVPLITNPIAFEHSDDDGDEDEASGYEHQKVADLKAEVDRRNAGRADADQVVVGGSGTKANLIAALEADDEKL